MSIIEKIKKRAKEKIRKIILPESMDKRVLSAASIVTKDKIAHIILLGEKKEIRALAEKENISLEGIEIIEPSSSSLTNKLIDKLYEIRKEKGLTKDEAKHLIETDYMYFACMLLKLDYADGIVSGACHSSSNTLRPALQIIASSSKEKLVSSFFLMCVPNCEYGLKGTFLFSDAGLIQDPTEEQLAIIADTSGNSFKLLTKAEPIIALLSHSTKGSATHSDVDKVKKAVEICKEKYQAYSIDGELQLDAAIVPEIAKIKAPNSPVAGKANVLIFPNLDAGNIGYKLVERLAKAESYGPITQGLKKPVNDLSRGCSIKDIIGVIAITALQVKDEK